MTDTNKRFLTTYNMVLIAISAAVITVCAWITVPVGPVPFTLQTMGILIVLTATGGKRGSIAVLLYLLLGLIGIPVFAGFKGGPASLIGPTGGFLIGFLLGGAVFFIFEKLIFAKLMTSASGRIIWGIVNSVIFEIVMYAVGVIWFIAVYGRQTGPIGLGAVMSMCVIPFLIPDVIKLVIAAVAGERISRIIKP